MDASHLLAPEGSGSFVTKSIAARAIGIPDGKTADAVLAELGVRAIRVGNVEFIFERDLQEALAVRRARALGIPTDSEAATKVTAERESAIAAGRSSPEYVEIQRRLDELQRRIDALQPVRRKAAGGAIASEATRDSSDQTETTPAADTQAGKPGRR